MITSIKLLVLSFFMLCLSGCLTFPKGINDHEFHAIKKGVQFKIDTYHGQKILIAKVDPNQNMVSLVEYSGTLKKISSVAREKKAVIAINGGFFQKNGSPAGALKINYKWIQKPGKLRGIMGWSKMAKSFYFDRVGSNDNGKMYSSLQNDDNWWQNQRYIVGGAPLLIYKGKSISPKPEKVSAGFLAGQYARTAVCMNKDNKLLFMVVRGGDRLSEKFGLGSGLNINELTQYLKKQSCVSAINLDGGRSSEMVIAGVIVNGDSFVFGERAVPSIILVQ